VIVAYSFYATSVFSAQTAAAHLKATENLRIFSITDLPRSSQTDVDDKARLDAYIESRRPQLSESSRNILVDALMEASTAYDVDPKLVAAVMSVESGFDVNAYNHGAIGLGQLMRGTARHLGIADPYSITQNVDGTTRYVVQMLDAWEDHPQQVPLALTSYLIGPGAAKKKASQGFGKRVHAYVGHVLSHYGRIKAIFIEPKEDWETKGFTL